MDSRFPELGTSRSAELTAPAKKPPWVDLRAGLDGVEKREFLTLLGLNSDPSVVQPVASNYADCSIPLPFYIMYEVKLCYTWAYNKGHIQGKFIQLLKNTKLNRQPLNSFENKVEMNE
jgi:hypothetical protein